MSCFYSALLPPVGGRIPWKPSHISPQVYNTGDALREVEMSLDLLAGTWTVFPQVSVPKHRSMARSSNLAMLHLRQETHEAKWENNWTQLSQFSPRIHLALYFVSSYSQISFIAFFPVSALGLVLPLPLPMLTPEPTPGSVPSSCDTGSRAGHKPSTLPCPSVCICLPHPEPTLHAQMSMLAKPLGRGGKGWPALCQSHC